MKKFVFDLEANGLNPDKIHCLSVKDLETGKIFSTSNYGNMAKFFKQDAWFIGHNIIRFDIPVLEKLLHVEIQGKLVDTLPLSWYLEHQRKVHGLEEWGVFFGVPKPPIEDWEGLSTAEYIHRCEEDVKINTLLWDRLSSKLTTLYGSLESAVGIIDYLMFKMDCAKEQERSRWKLDVDKCSYELAEMAELLDAKTVELAKAMPQVPRYATRKRPKKMYSLKDGSLTALGVKWLDLLKEQNLPEDTQECKYIIGYDEPNPASSDQIKDWLYSLGWEPDEYKFVRNKEDNTFRQIPQVYKKDVGVCMSVRKLYEKEPALELLDGKSVLSHRMSILKGFLRDVDESGYVRAAMQGLTNTLRYKHAVCVNMPKEERIRGCLVAQEGYELCGADLCALGKSGALASDS